MPAKRDFSKQRFWPIVGVPVPDATLVAIDKAAAAEGVAQGVPISRASFCRSVLENDSRVKAKMNGGKRAAK